MYNTIIGIGPPKTGTTYISRFFAKQQAYSCVINHCFEFHENILNQKKFEYLFGKNPDIIYYWHKNKMFYEWVQYIISNSNKCLFICTMRSYNDCLYSTYKHRLRHNMIKNIAYIDYAQTEKLNFLQLENNIIDFHNTIAQNSSHKLLILYQADLAKYEPTSLFSSMGVVGLEPTEYLFDDHKEWQEYKQYRSKDEDFYFDTELEEAYHKLQNNKIINQLTHRPE